MKIQHVFIYPIKSLSGIELSSAIVEPRGLQYDRRYMLVDETGLFLSQRSFPKLATLRTSLSANGIRISPDYSEEVLDIPFVPTHGDIAKVVIWEDTVSGMEVSDEANSFFSRYLDRVCKLIYMPDDSRRIVDPAHAGPSVITSFSDAYPIHILGTASLIDLNTRLSVKLGWDRFRPNIVVETEIPYEEDAWKSLKIGNALLKLVKPCARCVMTTINQQTADAGQEPLRTLASYRTVGNKVLFGMNAIPANIGFEVKLGESAKINAES